MGDDSESGLVVIGEVMGTHGAAGDLRVKPHNPDSALWSELGEVTLVQGGEARQLRMKSCRAHGKGLLVRLDGVHGRDAGRALFGAEICVPRALLPKADPDEYYVVDLIGARVELEDGSEVGTVVGYQAYPTVDVLQVRCATGVLELPLLEPYLVDADVDAGRVVVAFLEDLEVS